ncbi:transcriptional regulator, PaaX family [Pseudonocardia thermophila]|uniref:Transcriptional regulator, PaaX family n=1 Tax=Pseudonocardia thermophila TaxID=1848 RepID=A0A1M6SKH1_PSETH|nr:transcriptional regulator, PaaX family [Pseudonocardia thermophila]
MPVAADDLGLRPLSARSVVLSLLLGSHPPELPARGLVRGAERLGIAEQTLRVALTRMVAAGDLVRTETGYRLTERLLRRQQRQDAALEPATRPWRGQWEIVVITAVGRPAAERAELRAELTELRLAELRDGVWTRPANLRREFPADPAGVTTRFVGRPDGDPHELVATLWDLPAWAERARRLQERFAAATDLADRITVAAAIVRHLVADPVLPPALQPEDWPGRRLRAGYARFRAELPGQLLV